MNRGQETCRNFLRGSCKYGDRCRYLHVTQQQTRPNPYGFGSKSSSQLSQNSQQPKPNPFGFGFQDTTQLSGVNNFGARNGNPSKPFENKWIKPAAASNSASSQQPETQKQATVHECTDPESCKRVIVEDFKNEAPLWKLTCYGHWKYLPCDIVGDLSYEELRASAYEDAKRGIPLQSIIERERNLLNAKVTEFSALIQNPYVKQSSGPSVVNQFSVSSNTSTVSPLSNMPPTFSSFSQLGMSANVAPVMSFGNQLSGTLSNTVFGQPSFPKNYSQLPGGSKKTVAASGIFDGQLQLQQFGNLSRPSNSSITNGFMAMGSEQSSLHSSLPLLFTSSTNQSAGSLDGTKVGQSTVNQAAAGDNQNIGADDTIWSKEWDIGEIPEEEPPERVCFNVNFQTFTR